MDAPSKPYYLLMISVHGLIRGRDLELGRDADTGGQTKYVVDLTRALANRSDLVHVDLVTKRIVDPDVSEDYAQQIEPLVEGARIVRIDAGPEGYIPKEALWDHLDVFADNLLNWLNGQPRLPNLLHSHYGDAGYVAARLSKLTGIPLVHTGHSLGRDKRRRLLALGHKRQEIEERYNMSRRIDAEEEVLANASLIITSTTNEIEEQYELYDYYQPERMAVIPPGTDLQQFRPPVFGPTKARFGKQLGRFLRRPGKPTILTLSRADERKNIATLLEAYGESRQLQQTANLVIVAGNRDDIREMDRGAQSVLTELLLLIDYYDLYGLVAMPKHHRPDEVAEIFRVTASTGGVFVNPALTEPFGLTLLEAAASGLPVVATENGGPVDIIGNCKNGILVDPLNKEAITKALLGLLGDPETWRRLSANGIEGVRRYYSWQAHSEAYLKKIEPILQQRELLPARPVSRRQFQYHDRALFSDLDHNLLGNPTGLKALVQVLRENRKFASFGVATGRSLNSALGILRKFGIPMPDVLINSLGTDIRYAPELDADEVWADHIDHVWNPKAIRRLLTDLPGLEPQSKSEQGRFKISYHYDPDRAPSIDEINTLLRQEEQTVNVIHAFGQYLDVIPVRASKGLALRYFAREWDIPLERILVAGGSGADEDMMRGNTLAAVVANRHHEELNQLDNQDRIFFATQAHALGILEAIEHYDFYGACQPPQSVPDTDELVATD